MNSDELIAQFPRVGLVLALASRLRVGNGLRVKIIAGRRDPLSPRVGPFGLLHCVGATASAF